MAFAELRGRVQGAVFARLGEDARWNSQPNPVRVRWREEDEVAGYGDGSQLILRGMVLKVRRSEVQSPSIADVAELVADGRRFRIIADPVLNRNAVWECPVEEVTP